MKQVIWTPVAESAWATFSSILRLWTGTQQPVSASITRFRDTVFEHLQKSLPGHLHPHAPGGWLYLRFKRWLMVYQPNFYGIEVMRVIDAARDLPRRLRDGL